MKDKKVESLKRPGQHAVGGCTGLVLQVSETGARSWILRYRSPLTGKRREFGMGPYPEITLKVARERGSALVSDIRAGTDPIEERRAEREKARVKVAQSTTLAEAVDLFVKAGRINHMLNEKDRIGWKSMMRRHVLDCKPTKNAAPLGTRPVSEVTAQEVADVLREAWTSMPETSRRLRARLESVFAFAIVSGMRETSNPATWKGNLKDLMPRAAVRVVNQPALAVSDAPRWFAALRQTGGEAARALELVALTAMRSGEVRKLVWGEVDLDQKAINIPAAKMKAKRDFRVPLSEAAVAVLEGARQRCRDRGLGTGADDLCFPSPRGLVTSDMTLSMAMRRMHEAQVKEDGTGWLDPESKRPAVPHGMRATFKTWAQDHTEFPREMAEAALAHVVGGVEGAYARGNLFERRRDMMEAWARWLVSASKGK